MGRSSVAALLALAGCGRLSFDLLSDATTTQPDPTVDAPLGTMIVTFGETPNANYTGVTRDTHLNSASIGHNYGGEPTVFMLDTPQHVGLVRFDLSALAPGTIIAGATLHLSSTMARSGDLTFYEVLEDWDEGNKIGGTGTASWVNRKPGIAWAMAGAQPPGSRVSTPLATVAPAPAGVIAISFDPAALALFQRWVDAPASNFGLALEVSPGTGRWDFLSNESQTTVSRPLLELAIR